MIRIFVIGVCLLGWPSLPFGQEFESVIQQMLDERAKVTSYHVTITVKSEGEPESIKLANGKTSVLEKIPVGFTLELAVDSESKRRLIARQNLNLIKATENIEYPRWQVYLDTPYFRMYYDEQENEGIGRVILPNAPGVKPWHFDPLALGLMFEGEFTRGDSVADIGANYLTRGDVKKKISTRGGLLFYDGQLPKHMTEIHLTIDTERGHWPVEMTLDNPPIVEQKISVENIDGQWLPSEAVYVAKGVTRTLKFEWHSVNQPLDDSLFNPDDVRSKYDFKTDQR